MRDNKKDRPHQPRVQPRNLENGGFQQSYSPAGSYNHQPQQPTTSVPGYQYSHHSKIANCLEESSAVEGYPPNQHRYADSYYQLQPLQHQSAAPLPPRSGSSHQCNSLPPQSAAPLSPRSGSSHQHDSLPPQSGDPHPSRSSSSHQHNSLLPQYVAPLSPRTGSSHQHDSLPPQSADPHPPQSSNSHQHNSLLPQYVAPLSPRPGSSHQHDSLPPQSADPHPPQSSSSHQHNSLLPQYVAPLSPQSGSSHQHNSLPPQSAAPLPPLSGSSYQHNAHPPQSYAPLSSIHAASVQGYSPFIVPPPESNPSTQRYQSSNNYQAGQPSVPGGTPPVQGHARYVESNTQAGKRESEEHTTHNNAQQPPVFGNYPPSAPSTDWDDEYEFTPVAYPTHGYQHEHALVANHEHVQPVPNVYRAPHTQPSQEHMVQPQPSLPPSMQPRIRQSVVTSDSQVPLTKPLQQPSIVSTLSDASKPPDGYPTIAQHQPSPGRQSSECCCTIS